MLQRYHIVVMSIIVALGVGANFAFPDMRIPLPWTALLLIGTGALASSFYAFIGAARFSSPTLASENIRLSRFPQPIRFASDGNMLWSGVPVKGWVYLQKFINSASNPGVAILPASMLEQESEYYTLARCKLYHLTPRAVQVLRRKRVFRQMLEDMGHTDTKPLDVYFGFQSSTLHPDATHIRSPTSLSAFARQLSNDEREYSRVSLELQNERDRQLAFWQRVQGSNVQRSLPREDEEGPK